LVASLNNNLEATRAGPHDPVYAELASFYYDEAALLDERRFDEWLALLTDEMRYAMPIRPTLSRRQHMEFGSQRAGAFDETRATLKQRLHLAEHPKAWGEEPPARTRRFLSNLRVWRRSDDRILARVSVMMTVFRNDQSHPDILSGERHDVVLPRGTSFLLTERLVLLDQATLPAGGLTVPL
jgi:3-phenylpropionate/cinnamic acid dioxygenase small subunit